MILLILVYAEHQEVLAELAELAGWVAGTLLDRACALNCLALMAIVALSEAVTVDDALAAVACR